MTFKYLEIGITSDRNIAVEVKRQWKQQKNKNMPIDSKIRVYKISVRLILNYEVDTASTKQRAM